MISSASVMNYFSPFKVSDGGLTLRRVWLGWCGDCVPSQSALAQVSVLIDEVRCVHMR